MRAGRRWVSAFHVAGARAEARSVANAARREALAEAVNAFPTLLAGDGGRNPPLRISVGSRVGNCVVESLVGSDRLGHRWLLRCSCGGARVMRTAYAALCLRRGTEVECFSCQRGRLRALADYRRDLVREAFRKQWVDRRTLWTAEQTCSLMDNVRRDLSSEFGSVEESSPDLSAFTAAVGWPPCSGGVDAVEAYLADVEREREERRAEELETKWRAESQQERVVLDADELAALRSLEAPE